MDFRLSERDQEFVDLCGRIAADRVAKEAPIAWEEGRCPIELLSYMGSLGLLGPLVPEEWGGSELSTVALVAGIEAVGSVDQSVASAWQAHCTIGTLPLLMYGTDEQRERWVRPLAEGRALGAFGLTEPDAGSDARGIRTRAKRVDGGWLLGGQKTFISNAGTDMSFGVTVLARTESEGESPQFANFVVETGAEGYTQGPKMRGIGWRGLDTRELFFDDVFVPDSHVVGDPNIGFKQFMSVLEVGRITVASLGLGLASAALNLSLEYAKNRRQFGRPIADFQAIQFKLADIASGLEAARLLTFSAAWRRDQGLPFRKEAAMAKMVSSRLAVSAVSEAVQIFGGTGYMLDSPISRFYCDAKVLEIGEGTNEIQHLVIARELGC